MEISNEKCKFQPTAINSLADRLRKEIPNILELWESWVRQEVTAARSLEEPDLKDSFPKILETLPQALEIEGSSSQLNAAKEHGKQRSTFPQYTPEQIISEYRVLRRAIFEVLGKNVTDKERDIIIDAIEISISEAASEFTDQQHQIRERRLMRFIDQALSTSMHHRAQD